MQLRTLLLTTCGAIVLAASASAAPITWTKWSGTYTTSSSNGGSATGTAGSVNVGYSGELIALYFNYPSWNPPGTYDAGGLNGPTEADGGIRLYGGHTFLNTITFSQAVTNPYIAFWSLGAPGTPASFVFDHTPTLAGYGLSQEIGGTPPTLMGNTLTGMEANGVVRFDGTFTSISWNNPLAENYYMFTVGFGSVGSGGGDNPGVPEPMTLAVFGMGLAGLAAARKRKRQRQD